MKKRFLTLALCAMATLSLAACGKEKEVATPDVTIEEPTVEPEVVEPEQLVETYEKAVDVLTAAHVNFDEEMLGYLGGGYGEEVTAGAPGVFPLDDFETVRAVLTFPAEYIELVDEAGSMMHMMNGNLYTSAAFHVADNANMLLIEEAVLDTVKNNQWMCGFPEKLVIGQVENYVVYAYGNVDLVTMFEEGLRATELAEVKFIEDLVVAEETVEEGAEAVVEDGEAFEGEAFDGETVGEVTEVEGEATEVTEDTAVETEATAETETVEAEETEATEAE